MQMPLNGMLQFPCGSNYRASIHLIFSEHSQCSTYKRFSVYIPVLISCRCDKNPLLLSKYIKVMTVDATCFMHNYVSTKRRKGVMEGNRQHKASPGKTVVHGQEIRTT